MSIEAFSQAHQPPRKRTTALVLAYGNALRGQCRADLCLCSDLRWGPDQGMEDRRKRLRAASARLTALPSVADIVEPVDLVQVPPGWLDGSEIACRIRKRQRDLVRRGSLAVDEQGFLRIDEQLRSISHPQVFATGDCACWSGQALPKAGVHAVRMGPVLASNLRAALTVPAAAGDLRVHRPQRHFLALLATGDGRGIASRGPFGAEGAWAWRWKDRIDRRFLQQFVATQATPPHASQPARHLNPLAELSARHSGESQ